MDNSKHGIFPVTFQLNNLHGKSKNVYPHMKSTCVLSTLSQTEQHTSVWRCMRATSSTASWHRLGSVATVVVVLIGIAVVVVIIISVASTSEVFVAMVVIFIV